MIRGIMVDFALIDSPISQVGRIDDWIEAVNHFFDLIDNQIEITEMGIKKREEREEQKRRRKQETRIRSLFSVKNVLAQCCCIYMISYSS